MLARDEPVSEEAQVVGALLEVVGQPCIQAQGEAPTWVGGEAAQQLGNVLLQRLWETREQEEEEEEEEGGIGGGRMRSERRGGDGRRRKGK